MVAVGEIASKFTSSLLLEGVKRCYSGLSFAWDRKQKIERALNAKQEKDIATVVAEKSIDDLELVLGNSFGAFTEDVARFTREIEKSAIPEALVRAFLSNDDVSSLYPAFASIHSCFGDRLRFPPQAFFDALCAAVKLRLEVDMKDNKGLYEFIVAQNKKMESHINLVQNSLKNCKTTDAIDFDILLEARLKIAKSIETANRDLSVETQQGTKRVPLRQLIVPARLNAIVIGQLSGNRQMAEENAISFSNFKISINRVIVLGDPGGRKSTLSQFLCHELANAISKESLETNTSKLNSAILKLPCKIVLRAFERRQQVNPGYDFIDYLVDEFKTILESNLALTRRVITHLLGIGSILLLFDGLDEVLELEYRRTIVRSIEIFVSTYAACPVLITSRFVGYADAPMSADYLPMALARFNLEEVELFASRLIKSVRQDSSKEEVSTQAKVFVEQTKNIGDDLRENPLMLGLMVYLFVYKGEVPAYRPEIYKECATLMFERWDKRRDIIVDIPEDFDLLDVFAYLASKIFGSAETEEGVNRDWLILELRKYFEVWYLEKPRALKAARTLVSFITGRAWVMYEVGSGVYKFTHRTFLEYFFARHLISSSESVSELIRKKLMDKVISSQWDVISHLALHSIVYRDGGKMVQAANVMLDICLNAKFPPNEKLGFLLFASKSIEYLVLPEQLYLSLCLNIFELSIINGAKGEGDKLGLVCANLIRFSSKRESLVKPHFLSIFRKYLLSGDIRSKSLLVYLSVVYLSANVESDRLMSWRAVRAGVHRAYSIIGTYFLEVIADVRVQILNKSMLSVSESVLYCLLYKIERTKLIGKHGLFCLLRTDKFPWSLDFINVMDMIILEALYRIGGKPQRGGQNDDTIEILFATSDIILDGGLGPKEWIGKRYDFGRFCENITRYIYSVVSDLDINDLNNYNKCREIIARCLVVLAYCYDVYGKSNDFEFHHKGYHKGAVPDLQVLLPRAGKLFLHDDEGPLDREYKLARYMPSGPMEDLLKFCQGSEIGLLVARWNRSPQAVIFGSRVLSKDLSKHGLSPH